MSVTESGSAMVKKCFISEGLTSTVTVKLTRQIKSKHLGLLHS